MKKILSISLLLTTIFLLLGCNNNNSKSSEQKELTKNRKLWQSKRPQNYSFVVHPLCYCVDIKDTFVRVRDHNVSSAKYIPSNIELDEEAIKKEYRISGYFDFIQEAIDEDADEIKVDYNDTYGYPQQIAIDYNKGTADEEMSYIITHFNRTLEDGTVVCTKEYRPVCAKVAVQCITTPCESVEQTFSNRCLLDANPLARYFKDGEC